MNQRPSIVPAAAPAPSSGSQGRALPALLGNRFLTLSIPIRVFRVEVARDVTPIREDESALHTVEAVRALREAYRAGCPGGRLTWSFSLNALEDPRRNYRDIRAYVVRCQKEFGDEVTFYSGYFAAQYLPRQRINREMSQAIELVSKMVGGGYRPGALIMGFVPADCLQYLAQQEDIHATQGLIFSQHGVDNGDGDGSPCYPYYPSTEHFCKPAQDARDAIDCVNLDGWTVDLVTARAVGCSGHGPTDFNSRRGLGPIETIGGLGLDLGLRYMLATQAKYFDQGFARNGFGWVTSIWEAVLTGSYPPPQYQPDLIVAGLRRWLEQTLERWPQTHGLTFGEFGEVWRRQYRNNDAWNYRFETQGLGIADSRAELAVRWYMNKSFRLGLIRNWQQDQGWQVFDLTRYDLPAREPEDATPAHPIRNWTLANRINQKGLRPQDRPIPIGDLAREEIALITRYYPELG